MEQTASRVRIDVNEMLEAGVHFGHLRSKWNPGMKEYIFMEKNGIHLIDLDKSARKLMEAANAMRAIARSGRSILFVATKKQAKEIIREAAQRVNMPFVTERWLGGMLTNFNTVRKSIKKMSNIDRMGADGTINNMAKRERLMMSREREKLERVLGGIANLQRPPAAIFVVDIKREHIAVAEGRRLGLTTFGIADTNVDPRQVDHAIPGNDDAAKSIAYIVEVLTRAIEEGLAERKKSGKGDENDALPMAPRSPEASAEGEQAPEGQPAAEAMKADAQAPIAQPEGGRTRKRMEPQRAASSTLPDQPLPADQKGSRPVEATDEPLQS